MNVSVRGRPQTVSSLLLFLSRLGNLRESIALVKRLLKIVACAVKVTDKLAEQVCLLSVGFTCVITVLSDKPETRRTRSFTHSW